MNTHNHYEGKNKNNEYNQGRKVITVDASTILENIKQSANGDHNLVVYFSLEEFEEIYIESCKDALLNRNEIFVLATYYQEVAYVKKKMRMAGIDVASYERDYTLVLTDSAIAYQSYATMNDDHNCDHDGNTINTYNIIMTYNQLKRHTEKLDKNGVTICGDLGPFILNNRLDDLVSYEKSLPARVVDAKVRMICCYHKDDFEVLTEEQRQKIITLHGNSFIIA